MSYFCNRVEVFKAFKYPPPKVGDLSFYTLKEEDVVQPYDSWAASEIEYLLYHTDGTLHIEAGDAADEFPQPKTASHKSKHEVADAAPSKGNEAEDGGTAYEGIDSTLAPR
jgi:hypothetical protein